MWGLAVALVVTAAGCLLPSPREQIATNCQTLVHNFETTYCTNIIPTTDRHPQIAFDADQLGRSCQDPASRTRLRELDASCISAFRVATSERDREDTELRQRFAVQVAALKRDGAYLAVRDAYRVARDEAGIAAHEYEERGYPTRSPYERKYERTRKEADAALGRLHEVITRHGIEPRYGTVLDLW